MDCEGILKAGSESQDSDEPAPPGISKADFNKVSSTLRIAIFVSMAKAATAIIDNRRYTHIDMFNSLQVLI